MNGSIPRRWRSGLSTLVETTAKGLPQISSSEVVAFCLAINAYAHLDDASWCLHLAETPLPGGVAHFRFGLAHQVDPVFYHFASVDRPLSTRSLITDICLRGAAGIAPAQFGERHAGVLDLMLVVSRT